MKAQALDEIQIGGLVLRCAIGTGAAERAAPQEVAIDLTLGVDLRAAGRSDALGDTVDYAAVIDRVAALVEASAWRLVEALAERVAALCLEDPRVRWVRVRVSKPGLRLRARTVAVCVTRSRTE